MMPAPVTDEMVRMFSDPDTLEQPIKRTFVGEGPGVLPCEAVVHVSPTDKMTAVVRVPMRLEPEELTRLLKGGTVWVSMWGGLSPFAVEVVGAEDDDGSQPHAQKALHQRETEAELSALADV